MQRLSLFKCLWLPEFNGVCCVVAVLLLGLVRAQLPLLPGSCNFELGTCGYKSDPRYSPWSMNEEGTVSMLMSSHGSFHLITIDLKSKYCYFTATHCVYLEDSSTFLFKLTLDCYVSVRRVSGVYRVYERSDLPLTHQQS